VYKLIFRTFIFAVLLLK